MSIKISKDANENYLAKVVELKGIRKHSNADSLQTVDIDFNTIITGLDAKDGDIYIYFPLECSINADFLSYTNSFQEKKLNRNPEEKGFFGKNGRVKAIRLRGEKSMGYIVPKSIVEEWSGYKFTSSDIDKEFDSISGKILLEKYIPKVKNSGGDNTEVNSANIHKDIIGTQVRLHDNTKHFSKNLGNIEPTSIITISDKTHGTSWWVSNIITKRPLTFIERCLKSLKVNILDSMYNIVYGSRKLIKFKGINERDDLWRSIKNDLKSKIPEGFTLYGEALGYHPSGQIIQKGYDYGCSVEDDLKSVYKLEVYRVTYTNPKGLVIELGLNDRKEFCNKLGLIHSTVFFHGSAMEYVEENWRNHLGSDELEKEGIYDYLTNVDSFRKLLYKVIDKDLVQGRKCSKCSEDVPAEGVIVRRESMFSHDAFKVKSFEFLEYETKILDTGEADTESIN